MISWTQRTFQQHFRVIFIVLLVMTIIAFVFTIGAAPGLGDARTKALDRPFYGLNLGSQEDQKRLFSDAGLSVFLQAGFPALGGEQLQAYALQRHAALHLADQLHVPGPSGADLIDYVKTLRVFAGENGVFDPARYAQFRDNLKLDATLTESDVSRILADDYRYTQVQKLLAGPGYVLPVDVKQQLARAEAKWAIAVASADYGQFSPTVDASEANLTKFFEENAFRYEIPPQVKVRAVRFPAAAFVAQAFVDDAAVRALYDSNPARFPKPAADGKAAVALPATGGSDADFAAVRPQVEAALKLERARNLAAKAASDLTLALYEGKVAPSSVDAFLAARKLQSGPVPPFSRTAVPADLGGSPDIAAEAFRLGTARYFSDALPTPEGSVVLLWQESIPARQPLLVEVRGQVATDYAENEKRKRFVEAGRAARTQIESLIRSGKSLEQAAANPIAGLVFSVQSPPAFTLREPPTTLEPAVFGALESLEKGGVSEMVTTGAKGMIVHVADKAMPATDESNPRFVETRGQIAAFIGSRNAGDYLNELVEKELAKTAPATP